MLIGRQEEQRLFGEYHRTGDERARNAVVERFLPLARSLARRHRRGPEPLEDLEQVACLALVRAVEGFDPSRGLAFPTYAVPSIAGAIKRHFRDCGWSLHVPRDLRELAVRVERLSAEASISTGRSPTAAEIAAQAGVGVEDVLEAREAYRAMSCVSLDRPPASASEGDALIETLDADDAEIPRALDRAALDSLLGTLGGRERLIVRLHYQHDLTQAEIGRRLGCSQMHVSRLLRRAVARLAAVARDEPRPRPRPITPPRARGPRRSLPPSVRYVGSRESVAAR